MSRDWAADASAALNAGHALPDLDRAQWLLMSAKAEAAGAIHNAAEARTAAAWSLVFALVAIAAAVLAVIL